jgi:hypothetical protein
LLRLTQPEVLGCAEWVPGKDVAMLAAGDKKQGESGKDGSGGLMGISYNVNL